MRKRWAIAGAGFMSIACVCAGQLTNDLVQYHHYVWGCVAWLFMIGFALWAGWFMT